MITLRYIVNMAAYNAWMNDSLYSACLQLSDQQRKMDCGLFFGSVHKTLNHILWGDQIWTHRLAGWEKPASAGIEGSVAIFDRFEDLHANRKKFDHALIVWADGIEPEVLEGDLTWLSPAAGREVTKPRSLLFVHMFNHQTHHRGQVHGMLSQMGVRPPVTDLPFMD